MMYMNILTYVPCGPTSPGGPGAPRATSLARSITLAKIGSMAAIPGYNASLLPSNRIYGNNHVARYLRGYLRKI